MLIETMIICSLMAQAPYYNCNHFWVIEIYDVEDLARPGPHDWNTAVCPRYGDQKVYSCAVFMENESMDVFGMPLIRVGSSMEKDNLGRSPLQAALNMVYCRCY